MEEVRFWDDPIKSGFAQRDDTFFAPWNDRLFPLSERFWDDPDLRLRMADVASGEAGDPIPDQTPAAGPRERHTGGIPRVVQGTAALAKVIQEEDLLTIKGMQERTGVDSKRIYDIVNGFQWAGLLIRDPGSGVFRYTGKRGPHPIDLASLSRKLSELRARKQQKQAQVEKLRDELSCLRRNINAFLGFAV
jgi:hypothetical protein